MMIPKPGRNRAGQPMDIEIRAFAVDQSWYQRHWYGPEEVPAPRRPSALHRSSAGLAVLSLLIVGIVAWH